MKAILVTCPHCGARVKVTGTSAQVTCEYCGTAALVQRRTRVLERVLPPPPPPPDQRRMPVAVQRRGSATAVVTLLGTLLPVGIGVGATIYAQRAAQQASKLASTPASTAKPSAADASDWQGTEGVLVLPNGDILGRSRRVRTGDEVRVILLDGATGKPRWESASLGTYSDTHQGKLVLAGDLVVFASLRAEVRGIALAGGEERWRTQLPERVKELCDGGPDVVIAIGTDDVQRPLLRATGKPSINLAGALEAEPTKKQPKRKPQPRAACVRLPSDAAADAPRSPGSDSDLGRRLGIGIDRALAVDTGRILSGTRDKGTRVPTLVAVDAKNRERWRTVIPLDPFASQERAPEELVAGEGVVCVAYHAEQITTPKHVACFALADGHRLWDAVGSANTVNMLAISHGALLVGSWGSLEQRALPTGAVRWTFGR